MTDVDAFLATVSREVLGQLESVNPSSGPATHWLIVGQAARVELSVVEEGVPHELQETAIDQGADAVAYVSHLPGYDEQILAQVLVAQPLNSDIRRSHVSRRDGIASLGPWEYTV